jgi:hypothetical protein
MPKLEILAMVGLGAMMLALGPKKAAQMVAEGIENFKRPGPPTHPIPGDDSRILNRRRRTREDA